MQAATVGAPAESRPSSPYSRTLSTTGTSIAFTNEAECRQHRVAIDLDDSQSHRAPPPSPPGRGHLRPCRADRQAPAQPNDSHPHRPHDRDLSATASPERSSAHGPELRDECSARVRSPHNRTCFRVGPRLPDHWSPAPLGAESSPRIQGSDAPMCLGKSSTWLPRFRLPCPVDSTAGS